MNYTVLFNPLVYKEDFKNIDRGAQRRILKAIRKKLTTHPKEYGKPLSGELKGFWKLKVEDYRVIYEIFEKEIKVYVIMVGYRRNEEVYIEAAERMGLI